MNETKKMMEIIHQNRNKIYQSNLKKEIENKKDDKKFKILLFAFAITGILLVGTLMSRWNEKQVAQCMEAGHSENFCRYDGE